MNLTINIKKSGLITGLIILILLAVYNVLFFVIPFDFSKSAVAFWTSYGVTTFLVLFMVVVVALGMVGKELKSKVFGLPIIKLGYSVLIIQFVIDLVTMSVGNFYEIPAWILAIVEVFLLAFFFISLIARVVYKDTINKIDAKEYKESFIKELRIEMQSLYDSVKNENVKRILNSLVELVRYADPVSNKEVEAVEDEIVNKVTELKCEIENEEKALVLISSIINLIKERTSRLKASR